MPGLGPAVKGEAVSRLGPAEADAFLARLETLSFDITGPLGLLYGDVTVDLENNGPPASMLERLLRTWPEMDRS